MLKTIELILGLPPLTQYDAAAIPMVSAFMENPDLTPYGAETARIDLDAANHDDAVGAADTMEMNLEDFDDLTIAEEQWLYEVIWQSVKTFASALSRPVCWALGKPSWY